MKPQKSISQFRTLLSVAVALAIDVLLANTSMAQIHIRVMSIGDSITAGFTSGDWSEPFAFGYRSLLYQRLKAAGYEVQFVGKSGQPWNYHSSGVPKPPATIAPGVLDLRMINQDAHEGYGGKDASFLNARIGASLATEDPDVILLMIGINSLPQGSQPAPPSAMSDLEKLVETIVKAKPDARLIIAQITPFSTYAESIADYNRRIRETLIPNQTKLGHHVTTVDQYANFLKNPADTHSIDPTLFAGFNHPNGKGYTKMAETWFEGIKAVTAKP